MSHDHCKPVRYNRGMVRKEKRAVGTVWVFRWSEEVNRQRRQHKDVIGTTKEFHQQEAHKKVVQMVLPAEFSEKLKARSVTATA